MATRVLLTNDDGIQAEGLRAAHRALREVDELDVVVIAPDSNRSATARSITTRTPLSVEEVTMADGSTGYATDGTPVDCVRFADLGLGGPRPELIVSGINHGSNMGDDITYSGTVAAAFEGIVLGIPAIAVSQQSSALEMGFMPGRRFDFTAAATLTAELVRRILHSPLRPETLLNVNCPGREPRGVAITRLGKRVYEDELSRSAPTTREGAATASTDSPRPTSRRRERTSPRWPRPHLHHARALRPHRSRRHRGARAERPGAGAGGRSARGGGPGRGGT